VTPVVGLGALALAVYFFFHSPGKRSYHFRMTAGNQLGMRHHLAELLKTGLARRGIQLDLHETAGSEEALDEVNNHTLDLALVLGGLQTNGRPNVRQVLTLQLEALHLLVKEEWLADVSQSLAALEGKTVNLSESGSGTHSLAIETLAFAGLHARSADHPKGYIPMEMSRQQLFAQRDRARLPDAFLVVSLLPSPTVRYLVTRHGYRLVPLPFGEAFALESLAPLEAGPGGRSPLSRVDKGHIYPTFIPAFTYSVEPPVPARALATLGMRLLLVAHKDVDPKAIRTLVEATLASKIAKSSHPPIDAKILEIPPESPWHEGTQNYLHRNRPVVSGWLVDSAQKGMAIFAAAASGLFVLWQWGKQRGRFRHDRSFAWYIHKVARIEEQAVQLERDQPVGPGPLLKLREELFRLKAEGLVRFSQDELAGKEHLAGFLAQVNDTRDFLTRLIEQQGHQLQKPTGKEPRPVVPQ
jgi:TRAP-type uncharacterized transport system substrate-binding protein